MFDTDSEKLAKLATASAKLIHHTATPIATLRLHNELLREHLPKLLHATTIEIPPPHLEALATTAELVDRQLQLIEEHVRNHHQLHQASNRAQTAEPTLESAQLPDIFSLRNKLLLVEDEPIYCDMALAILSPVIQVDIANTGERVIELSRQNQYQIILMDLHLQDMDGWIACDRIRRNIGDATPMIGITNLPVDEQESLGPLNACLQKPLALPKLANCINKL